MNKQYCYPEKALLNPPRFLPKSKIFASAKATTKIKALFTRQINKITITHSLSNRSINLPATTAVDEILIFRIDLKEAEVNHDVLKYIDMAIRSPIIFELHYSHKQKTVAAFKRPSEADSNKWVVSGYFETDWLAEDAPRTTLPVSLDLGGLYEILLKPLMSHEARPDEDIQTHVNRLDKIQAKRRELNKIEAKLKKEKQFNRQVEINKELKSIKQELQQLVHI